MFFSFVLLAGVIVTMATPASVLVVDHNWDGVPLSTRAATVTLVAESEHLRLEVSAPFHGDPAPSAPAGPLDRLWEHEVVEVFVAGPAGADGRIPYTEIELGPHGHHLVLRLDDVRSVVEKELPLVFSAQIEGDRWHGVANVPWTYLPNGPWTGNAYALHGQGGDRRYRAASPVPGPAPDFHQPSRFRPLALERPPAADDVR